MAKVLWLASWYPNSYEPYNGDFIQRHARSVSIFLPVDVIHVLQIGSDKKINKEEKAFNITGTLREFIYAFAYRPTGYKFIDKVRYNLTYRKYYLKVIEEYIQINGVPSIIHVHVPLKAGIIARQVLRKYRIPYIVSEHASHYEVAAPDNYSKRSIYFKKNTAAVFREAALVTNVSAALGKRIKKLFRIKSVYTVYNVVDTSLFFYKAKQYAEKFSFIHVSSFNEQKNPKGIIEALALLKGTRSDWCCRMCGPASQEVIELVANHGLQENIVFTGEIGYKDVAEEMQKSDALILFSNHENFPCVVVEALCCGLPVISTNVGGISEAVDDTNGFLIPRGDVVGLLKKLIEMIDRRDEFDNYEISEKARALYNQHKIGKQFTELYHSVLGNKY
jgi:glycosyltransferase involved in cell wall biosynthesis